MYANVNGIIRGKDGSIQSAAETYQADIITLTETKQILPRITGYSPWIHKQRTNKEGGGVAIAVKEEIASKTTKVENIEDHEQEIVWIEYKPTNNNKIYIGAYYGKQEKEPREIIEREYSQLQTQINQLEKTGSIILTGDFNAKLKITDNNITQEQSPNGNHQQNY